MKKIINISNINQISSKKIIKNLSNTNLTITFDENSIQYINFFISQHPNQYQIYMEPNYKFDIDIVEYDFELYLFFIDCVDKAFENISKKNFSYQHLFGNIFNWNISICQNIMFDFPFTLSDVIYIPLNYIIKCSKSNDKIAFITTLIHEKLHIGQRTNELVWEKFILEQDNKWIKISNTNNIFQLIENNIYQNPNNLINTTNEEFISNPDTFYPNFKYVYLDNGKLYYGHYVYNKVTKKINKNFFQIDIDGGKIFSINKEFDQEHPYETYAYKISKEFV